MGERENCLFWVSGLVGVHGFAGIVWPEVYNGGNEKFHCMSIIIIKFRINKRLMRSCQGLERMLEGWCVDEMMMWIGGVSKW